MELQRVTKEEEAIVYRMVCELEETILDADAFHQAFMYNLADDSIQYYQCVAEGTVVGLASIRILTQLHHADQIAELEELYVVPSSRGAGVGTFLFQAIKNIAIEAGCYQLELSSHQKREGAHAFYATQQMNRHHYKFTINLK